MIRQQVASYMVNGKAMWGGQFALTNQRLLFRPLDTSGVAKMIKDGVEFLPGDLAILGKVVDKALDYSTAYGDSLAGAINTSEIVGVIRGRNAALSHPPSLVLEFADGRRLEIGVLKSIGSPNFLPSNNSARDEMIEAILSELHAH
ncbi:hypothetical protein [Streptomyces sp. SID13031]|uniref:hypothetical protein n=1 Tax=Streptomyces sp. SID13031 TaxID=2706046 RepID=UPI0013CB7475|nr:hypothetical protein [Streptomyces sp. SID13031]NEA36926.1 hypothetical protein [Streptomyces sp. SID13031]